MGGEIMSNDYKTVAVSETRTSPFVSHEFTNWEGRGLILGTNVTSINGSIIVSIRGKDLESGKFYDVLTSTAIIASGLSTMTVYPGIAASSNVTANSILPQTWDVVVTASGTATYSIGASVVG
jgi:hypothetical protein